MKTSVLLVAALFTLGNAKAQYTQNFEAGEAALTNNCWTLDGLMHTTDPAYVITGSGSMYTNPPSGAGRTMTTPAINMIQSVVTIGLKHKISNPINGTSTRTIEIGIVNAAGTYTSLKLITLDKFSPTGTQNFSEDFSIIPPGIYKIVVTLGGSGGDGNCRLIVDDLTCSANAMYGAGTCNAAPVAVNDVFLGTKGVVLTGNVLTNDSDPDGELIIPATVQTTSHGTLVLNSNGSFVFTPNAGWSGNTETFTYNLNDNGFSPMISNTATVTMNFAAPAALPVKLTSFTATLNNNKADLKWTTASEINVSHFVIEKSIDGNNYTEAGVVFAAGNSSEKVNYTFSDNLAATTAKVVYYRLRSVDVDAKSQLSETRIIRLSKSTEAGISILAYPNPVVSELRVTVPSNWQNKKVTYEVVAANGATVVKKETASAGQTENINVNMLGTGFYMVRVNCNGETAVQKIVKQ